MSKYMMRVTGKRGKGSARVIRRGTKAERISRRRRISIAALCLVVFVTVLTLSYLYRDYLLAYAKAGPPPEGETELPLTDTDPAGAGPVAEPEPEEPAPDRPETDQPGKVVVPSPEPSPPGEWLHIGDGNYLLALVTKQTTLGRYAPADLAPVRAEIIHPDQRQWRYFLRAEAYEHLARMWEAARAGGVALIVISAYRDYDTQAGLFRDYASRHGESEANTFSARPGQSEHQLGTAVDFGGTASDKNRAFGETAEGRWLAANAHRYGFAMSYPEGSHEISGYIYEPWHFRYIGVEAAAAWKDSGLVLCQFLSQQPQYWLD